MPCRSRFRLPIQVKANVGYNRERVQTLSTEMQGHSMPGSHMVCFSSFVGLPGGS